MQDIKVMNYIYVFPAIIATAALYIISPLLLHSLTLLVSLTLFVSLTVKAIKERNPLFIYLFFIVLTFVISSFDWVNTFSELVSYNYLTNLVWALDIFASCICFPLLLDQLVSDRIQITPIKIIIGILSLSFMAAWLLTAGYPYNLWLITMFFILLIIAVVCVNAFLKCGISKLNLKKDIMYLLLPWIMLGWLNFGLIVLFRIMGIRYGHQLYLAGLISGIRFLLISTFIGKIVLKDFEQGYIHKTK